MAAFHRVLRRNGAEKRVIRPVAWLQLPIARSPIGAVISNMRMTAVQERTGIGFTGSSAGPSRDLGDRDVTIG
jgi:hypothetical protein